MQVFKSRFGRVITILISFVMGLAFVTSIANQGIAAAISSLPVIALLVYLVVILFWLPRVEIDEGGVRIINVIRTHYVSWGAISRIDTRYALTLFVGEKKYVAWGATAPGRHAAFFATRDQGTFLPESTYLAGTVRPGDLTTSDSGAAAAVIRERWEKLQGQDLMASVATSWHLKTILLLLILILTASFIG